MTSTTAMIKHWRNELKKISEDGKTSHIQGWTESILWKSVCYQEWFIDFMQSP
jgi:hypothetical protein